MDSSESRAANTGVRYVGPMQYCRVIALLTATIALIACGNSDPLADADAALDADTSDSNDAGPDDPGDVNETDPHTPDTFDTGPVIEDLPWLDDDDSIDTDALRAWMRNRAYRDWAAGSLHPSTQPPGNSRAFIGPTLATSLEAESQDHPIRSVGAREIYDFDGITLLTTNILLKLDGSDGEPEWWFFELTDPNGRAEFTVEETFAPGCLQCHFATTDFVMSTWPLE